MRSFLSRAILAAAIAVSACGGSSQEQDTEPGGGEPTPVSSGAASEGDTLQPDSMAIHARHGANVAAAAGDSDHSAHGAQSGGGDHSAHGAAPGVGAAAGHAGHAAGADQAARAAVHAASAHGDSSMHAAQHAAAGHDTIHGAHMAGRAAGAASPDTAHAAHAAVSDTSHAMHADTAHAIHVDTAHAMHADTAAHAQPHAPAHGDMPPADTPVHQMPGMSHRMWMQPLGRGWTLMGMAQAFPIVSTSFDADDGSALDATELYLTQPAVMFNIESPGSRVALRTTLNFEGMTQPDGELTFGGWGEGFLDRRHPHTLLHELMLSVNLWGVAGGDLSISAGKGFAPYGTDDPMSRPAVKYPTNHHLSQILERWTVNGVYVNSGWSLEAALFGGGEPEGPYDFSNIESFGDSWSARVARRFGDGYGPMAATELAASFGRVREVHHDEATVTRLYNAAVRHERMYSFGTLYGLVEGSMSDPDDDDGYFSVLGETKASLGDHQPYYRIEYATRPEYPREGAPGTQGFFRYDHDAHAIGATRWLINTIGYGYSLTGYPVSARPFVEVQHNRVGAERGVIEPQDLFGRRSFWGLSAGFRVFLGGDPMRMGAYGVLDEMTVMHRAGPMAGAANAHTDHN